jgi:predicted amidohydrolase
MALRVALVQMVCEKGDVRGNLDATLRILSDADQRQIDVVAFPEASLSGYADPIRYPTAVLALDDPPLTDLLEATRDLDLTALVGLIERNPTGGKPYITHLIVQRGALLGIYRKMTVPEEDDPEDDWYTPGEAVHTFEHGGTRFGIGICADLGNEQVYADAARQGARIVFEVAAPGLYGEQATRNWRSGFEWWRGECASALTAYTRAYGIWAVVATQAGRTVDEDFPGGAYVFSPDGRRQFASEDWRPGEVYVSLDLSAGSAKLLSQSSWFSPEGPNSRAALGLA